MRLLVGPTLGLGLPLGLASLAGVVVGLALGFGLTLRLGEALRLLVGLALGLGLALRLLVGLALGLGLALGVGSLARIVVGAALGFGLALRVLVRLALHLDVGEAARLLGLLAIGFLGALGGDDAALLLRLLLGDGAALLLETPGGGGIGRLGHAADHFRVTGSGAIEPLERAELRGRRRWDAGFVGGRLRCRRACNRGFRISLVLKALQHLAVARVRTLEPARLRDLRRPRGRPLRGFGLAGRRRRSSGRRRRVGEAPQHLFVTAVRLAEPIERCVPGIRRRSRRLRGRLRRRRRAGLGDLALGGRRRLRLGGRGRAGCFGAAINAWVDDRGWALRAPRVRLGCAATELGERPLAR